MRLSTAGVLLLCGLACGANDKPSDAGGGHAAAGDSAAVGEDTAAPGDTAAPEPVDLPLLNGLYVLGFNVGPVAGLVVPLQVEAEMSVDEDGNRRFDTFIIRASDGVDAVSDDLAVVEGFPVAADGAFEVDVPPFILPSEFSPTSNPVEIDSVMTGEVRSESFFCGEVSGTIVSFEMDLAGSSFGGIPWDDRILGAPGACEEIELEEVPRIVDCPVLESGRTMDFPSGEKSREVELVVPEGHSTDQDWPLLLALHGIGSDIDALIERDGLREAVEARGIIVAAPQAMERGGTATWDPVGAPEVNLDVVLVDDLITCVSAQYNVDPDRIYITGMSLGGIMTGTLLSTRSEVFAAAMPFSGGFMTAPSAETETIPTLVAWGGVDDTYYGQDFDYLASIMIPTLVDRGHGVVSCNHGMGHMLDESFWTWALTFLEDHTRVDRALAYDDALPDVYPDYCQLESSSAD